MRERPARRSRTRALAGIVALGAAIAAIGAIRRNRGAAHGTHHATPISSRTGNQRRLELARLAREFPSIRWVLVGDDGQHDPQLYGDFASSHPDHVRAIGIRQLTPTEQVLSHGKPVPNQDPGANDPDRPSAATVHAPDGHSLLPLLRSVLSSSAEA